MPACTTSAHPESAQDRRNRQRTSNKPDRFSYPLVTIDELQWGKPLRLRTEINGEVRRSADTSDLIFGVEELVSYISRFMTLFLGGVLQTGSPAGVAFFMQPQRFRRHGDRVRREVERLAAIENLVREQ